MSSRMLVNAAANSGPAPDNGVSSEPGCSYSASALKPYTPTLNTTKEATASGKRIRRNRPASTRNEPGVRAERVGMCALNFLLSKYLYRWNRFALGVKRGETRGSLVRRV